LPSGSILPMMKAAIWVRKELQIEQIEKPDKEQGG
jgi:hypothetical protein